MKLQKNQELTVEIVDMNMMGYGVAKVDQAVIFVQNAVVGEQALIRIIKCAKNYYVARIQKLLRSSDGRIEPKCKVFHRCGGCSFQHISYEFEKKIKRDYVEQCLKKAGVENVPVLKTMSTDDVFGYRNKAQYPVALSEDGNVIAGFFSPHSHKVCSAEDCSIQDPAFAPIVKFVCSFLSENKISPYQEENGSGLVRHIYLRRSGIGEIMLCLVLREDRFDLKKQFVKEITALFPEIKSIFINLNSENTNVILGKETKLIWGKDRISERLCGKEFLLSPHSFFQVNRSAAELLYRVGFEMAEVEAYDLLIDLYCGIGSIGLCAPVSTPILGVEIVSQAVSDAMENAKRNHRENCRYLCGDATELFQKMEDYGAVKPLLILDPPRKGISSALVKEISNRSLENVLYISCGPDTLARDIKLFSEEGYVSSAIQPVDLFPRTSHVECVAFLTRK